MRSYPMAAQGLRKMFLAYVLMLIGTLTAWLLVGWIFALVGEVLYFMGLYQAKTDHEGYGSAFYLAILILVLDFLARGLRFLVLGPLLELAGNIVSMVVIYLVCSTTSLLARSLGRPDLAEEGKRVWKLNLVCYLIQIVFAALLMVPLIGWLALVSLLITGFVMLIGGVWYVLFLRRASMAFA